MSDVDNIDDIHLMQRKWYTLQFEFECYEENAIEKLRQHFEIVCLFFLNFLQRRRGLKKNFSYKQSILHMIRNVLDCIIEPYVNKVSII